jgi:hypothetical protein
MICPEVADISARADLHQQAAQVRIVGGLEIHGVLGRREDRLAVGCLDLALVLDRRREE